MATITSLVGTDGITTANSMTKINTNFANLNSDKIETSTIDTDTALTANSDSKIATQKAVKAYVDTGGNVNASETTKGIVEEATDAEVTAGTATGATGAKLFITPAKLATRISSLTTPTTQVFTASGTWTKPAGLKYVRVKLVGGGGPGQSMTKASTSTTNGGSTSFGSHLSATGGNVDGTSGIGSSGNINYKGQRGVRNSGGGSASSVGGIGGASFLGAGTNYGGGGMGGDSNSSGNTGGGGGGAGGGSEKTIVAATLGSTETVTVGAGGVASPSDTNPGEAGGPGVVIVEEYYV